MCYVFLADVDANFDEPACNITGKTKQPAQDLKDLLAPSRWFTRGWTLQELIAPARVDVFDRHWRLIGHLSDQSLLEAMAAITGIHRTALLPGIRDQWRGINRCESYHRSELSQSGTRQSETRQSLSHFSVAQRMSWSAHRTTTCVEDGAYCLLGLFDVNI